MTFAKITRALTVPALLLACLTFSPYAVQAGGEYFSGSEAQINRQFMSRDQWQESMRAARRYCDDNGIKASYEKLARDWQQLADRSLRQVRVNQAKDIFAQAVYLYLDDLYSGQAIEVSEGETLRTLKQISARHRVGKSSIVDPKMVMESIGETINQSQSDSNILMDRLITIFQSFLMD
ncbi:MAG: hypothetical protein Q4F72_04505 [Desulfovibrionaceae bacterium]|nr:hypothetical protein [Desulfovibrionaceae bacterium]